MWHMFALFTQQPSVNWYTERKTHVWCLCVCVCVCVCVLRWLPAEGIDCPWGTRAQEHRSPGCPRGFGARTKAQTPSTQCTARIGAAAAAAGRAWLIRSWMESYEPLLFPPPPVPALKPPASNFNQSPCPFQLTPLDQNERFFFPPLLCSPLSGVMGLQIWQLCSPRLDSNSVSQR